MYFFTLNIFLMYYFTLYLQSKEIKKRKENISAQNLISAKTLK